MKVGYARTSTADQVAGLAAQIERLGQERCEEIFKETVSAVGVRPELDRALNFVRKGDVLIVTKLDRLARSVAHLCSLVAKLKEKGVALQILDMNLDTSTPTGELMVNLLGSIAQFERSLMLERQKDGVAKAKAEGKYRGRAPTARAKTAEIIKLVKAGVKREDVAQQLGIGVASVYRILAESGVRKTWDVAPAESENRIAEKTPVAPVARVRSRRRAA
jgi:DNA invertase Pin-like site-specific DNA recombinase